jgi:hypothetical protein
MIIGSAFELISTARNWIIAGAAEQVRKIHCQGFPQGTRETDAGVWGKVSPR